MMCRPPQTTATSTSRHSLSKITHKQLWDCSNLLKNVLLVTVHNWTCAYCDCDIISSYTIDNPRLQWVVPPKHHHLDHHDPAAHHLDPGPAHQVARAGLGPGARGPRDGQQCAGASVLRRPATGTAPVQSEDQTWNYLVHFCKTRVSTNCHYAMPAMKCQ